MSRRNVSVLITAIMIALLCAIRSEDNPYARFASRGFRLIDDLALEQPTDQELLAGAMRGMVDTLRRRGDEHSAYIAPSLAKPFQAEMRQEFGGIGVRIAMEGEPQRVTVVEPPMPGAPAYRAGVMAGDQILAVDGESLDGLPSEEVLDRMRGPAGKAVALKLQRSGKEEPFTLKMVREVIRLPSVIGDLPLEDGGWQYLLEEAPEIAYLRITTFGNRTTEELREALESVQRNGAQAVILDVRGNGGGAVDTAIGVAELFLEDGAPIFSTRGRDGEVLEEYNAMGNGPFRNLPIAMLVDRDSASASELVAAALQDDGKAVVVGERSFGKGTVQQVLELDGEGALLKLTSASFWRPSGVNIHRASDSPVGTAGGVSPDEGLWVEIAEDQRFDYYVWRRQRDLLPAEDLSSETPPANAPLEADPVLARAVEHLRAAL